MANTYTQLYIHIVFSVLGRESLISKSWQDELYKYISGIIKATGHKLYVIGGMPDHVHILVSIGPNTNLSELVRDIKANSSKWINEKSLVKGKFKWQEGFGAFTYGQSQLPVLIDYIKNQEAHHSTKSFREEYHELLKKFEIDFDEKYIFKNIE